MAINDNMTIQFSISLDFASSYFVVTVNDSGLYLDAWSDVSSSNYLLKANILSGSLVWNYEIALEYQPRFVWFILNEKGISLGSHATDLSKFDIKYYEILSTCSYCLNNVIQD